ncbi:MAG: hypothetical protein HY744_00145 [Deltaproteobacteria bacterium]|nr:hypothetical protein [Deltaproteobacteria bacterium]
MRRAAFCLACLLFARSAAAEPAGDDSELWPERRGFSFRVSAGPAFRQLYSVPIGLGELEMAFGALTSVGWYGRVGGLLGATEQGLVTRQLYVGTWAEALLGRWHLGVGPQVSRIWIWRATRRPPSWDDAGSFIEPLAAWGGGLSALSSFDLFADEAGRATYVALKASADVHEPNGAVLYGFSGLVGARY